MIPFSYESLYTDFPLETNAKAESLAALIAAAEAPQHLQTQLDEQVVRFQQPRGNTPSIVMAVLKLVLQGASPDTIPDYRPPVIAVPHYHPLANLALVEGSWQLFLPFQIMAMTPAMRAFMPKEYHNIHDPVVFKSGVYRVAPRQRAPQLFKLINRLVNESWGDTIRAKVFDAALKSALLSKANFNEADAEGRTALHRFAIANAEAPHHEAVQEGFALLNNGLNPDLLDKAGKTAADYASDLFTAMSEYYPKAMAMAKAAQEAVLNAIIEETLDEVMDKPAHPAGVDAKSASAKAEPAGAGGAGSKYASSAAPASTTIKLPESDAEVLAMIAHPHPLIAYMEGLRVHLAALSAESYLHLPDFRMLFTRLLIASRAAMQREMQYAAAASLSPDRPFLIAAPLWDDMVRGGRTTSAPTHVDIPSVAPSGCSLM